MRSSKSRSRSKSNRNRPNGANVVNRVFDSSGPEGKVRGTPQQIIDKYNQLARDAQLGNDRVATENFQQHAEHYLRMLNEAQREIEARREEQERQNRERQAERDRERQERLERQEREAAAMAAAATAETPAASSAQNSAQNSGQSAAPAEGSPQPDIVDPRDAAPAETGDASGDSGLVSTPEGEPQKKPAQRKPRARKPKPAETGEAAGAEVAEKPKRTRKPKPKAEAKADAKPDDKPQGDASSSPEAPEAAE